VLTPFIAAMNMQTENLQLPTSGPKRRHWVVLSMISLGIVVVWLIILPRMAHLPAVQQRRALFESRGIDPAAMFYTELELLDSPNNRLQQWQREHPDALWKKR
jgi:hypothetical protein